MSIYITVMKSRSLKFFHQSTMARKGTIHQPISSTKALKVGRGKNMDLPEIAQKGKAVPYCTHNHHFCALGLKFLLYSENTISQLPLHFIQ